MNIDLIPGGNGERCPGNPELCDECDYLICCTDYNRLCGKCFETNGFCPMKIK